MAAGAWAQVVSGCNPEMPRYTEWSASRHFPYQLDSVKQKELGDRLSGLSLGSSIQQVKAAAGVPDFVSDGSLQPNAVACMWLYVFEDQGPASDPRKKHAVVLGFSQQGALTAVESQKVNNVKAKPVDTSCEPYASPTAGAIAEILGAGKAYVAPEQRQAKVRAGYSHLSLGMGVDEVESLLGSPDSVNVTSHGHVGNVWIPGEPCKRQFIYILRQNSSNPIDPETAAIYLTFDRDKLFWAAPQNVEGLKTMGAPAQ
ncbi:MAG TPA: hypothetical protein VFB04_16575 [Terriglobales bacterium]|nr:hypothetical protein [Terriglobales bacterium]